MTGIVTAATGLAALLSTIVISAVTLALLVHHPWAIIAPLLIAAWFWYEIRKVIPKLRAVNQAYAEHVAMTPEASPAAGQAAEEEVWMRPLPSALD